MADEKREREKFEAWLGTETCEVHVDESANKNAWYGWLAGSVAIRVGNQILWNE
jgi:hypothetical protein